MKRNTAPLTILTVGFLFSLAANMLWTWDGGIVRILGGALASLALPGALHLWPKIPVTGKGTRLLRGAAMTLIAAMAAVTTFAHASGLLIQHGEEVWLACLYPVMTELLVAMGVLALHVPTPHKPVEKKKATPSAAATADRPHEVRPERAPRPVPAAPPPGKKTLEQVARDKWPLANAAAVMEETGCKKAYSHTLFNKLRAELGTPEPKVLEPVP